MAKFENINSPPDGHSLEKQIRSAVAQAVEPLLHSGDWRTYRGPQQELLMRELADLMSTEQGGLASSGTAALEMVLRACRFEAGSEIMLSAYDYPGNFAAIENSGCRPVLVDVAACSWNVSIESLVDTWSPNCKALIVSHLHGQLQDVQWLGEWCSDRGMRLIQDACQAVGATIGDQRLGTWADATILSFGGSKTLSAGRGGAWCTSDASLAQHTRVAAGVGSGAYEMSELQAAIIVAQLPFLDQITSTCRLYFAKVSEQLNRIEGIRIPWMAQLESTAFYQAGWIAPENASTLDSVGTFVQQSGQGFDGFHRRSERRCRKARSLENAAMVAARTKTIHHRQALDNHP